MNGYEFCQPCGFYHPASYDCNESRRMERLSKFIRDTERDAYRRGYEDGRADQAREIDRVWAAQPLLQVAITPSHAELDALRYPDGRSGRHPQAVTQ